MALLASPPTPSHLTTKTLSDDQFINFRKKGVKHLVDTEPNLNKLPKDYVHPTRPAKPISCSNYAAAAEIPVIDLSGLEDDVPAERRKTVVQAIGSACAEWGVFNIINHGVKISLIEKMLKAIEEFFNLPVEEKMKYASDDVMDPVRYGTSLNTPMQHTLHWRDYLRHWGRPIDKSIHLWPDNPPHYRAVAKEYLEEFEKLQLRIAGAISESLGLERDYFEKAIGEGFQFTSANYYPPCPEPDLTLGLASHSDHGGVNILMQNDVDGLQFKHGDTWVPVHLDHGMLVVNIGDFIEILSNGRYKSTEHRGVVNAEKTRISITSGLGPALSATIGPASPLVDENSEVKFKPITYNDYMRFQQTTVARGKSALHAIMNTMASTTT